jgi:hypothetical protein
MYYKSIKILLNMQVINSNIKLKFIEFTKNSYCEIGEYKFFGVRLSRQDYNTLVSLSLDCGHSNLAQTIRMLIKYVNSGGFNAV